jgi:hypothetical protein
VRNGALPVVPAGVLATARLQGQDRVTWQPAAGLRFAVVARAGGHGRVVMGGQSLAPFEDRDKQTMVLVGLGWLASIACLAGGLTLTKVFETRAAAGSRWPSNRRMDCPRPHRGCSRLVSLVQRWPQVAALGLPGCFNALGQVPDDQ